MSYQEMNRVFVRAVADSDFRRTLLDDPASALAGYDLDPDEADSLARLTEERIYTLVGARAVHGLVPVPVSPSFTVIPVNGSDAPTPDNQIALLPDMVFGNGTHPTTRVSLLALEQYLEPGMTVLDLGTGSGILSIAAVKLGAARVLAVDISFGAVHIARQNMGINRVEDRIQAACGSLDCTPPDAFDLVVANILPHVLIDMLKAGLGERLRPGGVLIMSGIWQDYAPEVEEAGKRARLDCLEGWNLNGWVGLAFRRPESRGFLPELSSLFNARKNREGRN